MNLERIATEGGAILYDPSVTGNAPGLFDRERWIARGALRDALGGRGAVAFLDDGAAGLVLRRYLRGGLAARVSHDRYLWLGETRTRAWREFGLLYALSARRLPVPTPVAARYLRRGLTYQAELVTARLPGSRSLAERWLAGEMRDESWLAAGRCIRRFHDAGVQHADLNAHNVMLGEDGEVWLLDFDRGRLRRPGRWQGRVIARLARSLSKLSSGQPGCPDWRAGFALLCAAHGPADTAAAGG